MHDHLIDDDRKPQREAEIPVRWMDVTIRISAPNVDDMRGQPVAEIEAEMEQRTSRDKIRESVRCNCFDIISVAAVEAGKRKTVVCSEQCECGHNMSDHLTYSAECYAKDCTCKKFQAVS